MNLIAELFFHKKQTHSGINDKKLSWIGIIISVSYHLYLFILLYIHYTTSTELILIDR